MAASIKDELLEKLQFALRLEHLTIPPYLTAMFSIKDGTNLEVVRIIRSVVMEEMLHMVLVGNVMNALGGKPRLTGPEFLPDYPTLLPFSARSFRINLQGFSQTAVDEFMAIEMPDWRTRLLDQNLLPEVPQENEVDTIGEFYQEIIELLQTPGSDALFSGDRNLQIGPEHYYGGGGRPLIVHDRVTAVRALEQIKEQGEGKSQTSLDDGDTEHEQNWEPAHYYRFQSIKAGRAYEQGNVPDFPKGRNFEVDFGCVYPTCTNPRVEDFPSGSARRVKMEEFNRLYQGLLGSLEGAFCGKQDLLSGSVHQMYELKYAARALMRTSVTDDDPSETMGPSYQFVLSD